MRALRVGCAVLAAVVAARAAEKDARQMSGGLQTAEFAAEGMVGSVVGITLDDQGRVYVTHTMRRTNGEIDIRKNREWLLESLALSSAEDRQALIQKRMPTTWQDLAKFKEKVIRLDDTDGDGRADKRTVVFEGLNELGSGLAGGVLWHEGALYVTCMPSLWKLTDRDGDGLFETKQELVRGIGFHIGYGGHDMHGPTLGPDGRIYWTTGDKGIHVKTPDGRDLHFPGQGGCFRIEPDGSNFEVFAHGLRNAQELAFDEWGNLFSVDNDGDFGDQERVVHIVEGADYGWRMHYQFRSDRSWAQMAGYNAWMAESLWRAPTNGLHQPAYLMPGIANFSTGPIGIEYNPGTALGEKWRSTFFLAESSKKISAFNLEPSGADFRFVNPRTVVNGPFNIGIFFGPDGALYGANWGDNAWVPHEKGSVLKFDEASAARDTLRENVRAILQAGMAKRGVQELAGLLAHSDQRVRLRAQFELVRRNERATLEMSASTGALLSRVHAIWGLGQLARKGGTTEKLLALLGDAEAEVRAQAARMLGDAKAADAADAVAKRLDDTSPRVRYLAAVALRAIGTPAQFDAAVKLLEANNGADLVLRHAGAMALAGCARTDRAQVAGLSKHPSQAVRVGAVLAARLLADPSAAAFLGDADSSVVGEAARAIHDDLSIPAAMPALAALLERPGLRNEAALRRAISANIRVGDAACAKRLLAFAETDSAPSAMRVEALDTLAMWPVGLAFDRVQGVHRGLPARDARTLKDIFAGSFDQLVSDNEPAVQQAAARLVRSLNYSEGISKLSAIAFDAKAAPEMRVVALQTMSVARAPRVKEAIALLGSSPSPELRVAAIRAQAEMAPDKPDTFAAIEAMLASGGLREKQAMFALLGTLKNSGAEKVVGRWLKDLTVGKVAPEIALDVYEAGVALDSKTMKQELKSVDSALKKRKADVWSLALVGGDATEGDGVFHEHTTAACMQCHTLNAGVQGVGPGLADVATRLSSEDLLRSVVDPQAKIADGFRLVSVTMKDGSLHAGLFVRETKDEVVLRDPAGTGEVRIRQADVASKSKAASAMPDMTSLLTRMEVRNLVAYLQTLKGTTTPASGANVIASMKMEDVLAVVAKTRGDAKTGEKIFTRQGCVACHTVNAVEPLKGPFLGRAAKTYDRTALAEHILAPAKTIAKGFELVTLTLKNGTVQGGFIVAQAPDRITLRNIAGIESHVARADIAKQDTNTTVSLMPPGLVNNLSVVEFASLLDWFEQLAARP